MKRKQKISPRRFCAGFAINILTTVRRCVVIGDGRGVSFRVFIAARARLVQIDIIITTTVNRNGAAGAVQTFVYLPLRSPPPPYDKSIGSL